MVIVQKIGTPNVAGSGHHAGSRHPSGPLCGGAIKDGGGAPWTM